MCEILHRNAETGHRKLTLNSTSPDAPFNPFEHDDDDEGNGGLTFSEIHARTGTIDLLETLDTAAGERTVKVRGTLSRRRDACVLKVSVPPSLISVEEEAASEGADGNGGNGGDEKKKSGAASEGSDVFDDSLPPLKMRVELVRVHAVASEPFVGKGGKRGGIGTRVTRDIDVLEGGASAVEVVVGAKSFNARKWFGGGKASGGKGGKTRVLRFKDQHGAVVGSTQLRVGVNLKEYYEQLRQFQARQPTESPDSPRTAAATLGDGINGSAAGGGSGGIDGGSMGGVDGAASADTPHTHRGGSQQSALDWAVTEVASEVFPCALAGMSLLMDSMNGWMEIKKMKEWKVHVILCRPLRIHPFGG